MVVVKQSSTIFERSRSVLPWLSNPASRHLCAELDELLALESEAKLPPKAVGHAKASGACASVKANGNSVTRACCTAEHQVLLIVDQRITMLFGSKRQTKAVVAARAAAFLAWRALALRHRVGALIFNDHQIVHLRPECSRLRVRLILYAVLNQNHGLSRFDRAQSNVGMLNQVLRRAATVWQNHSFIFLISDGSGYNEETPRLVKRLCGENMCLVALVYDPRQVERSAWKCSPGGSFNELEKYACASSRDEEGTGPRRSRPQIGSGLFACEAPVVHLSTHENLIIPFRRAAAGLEDSRPLGKASSNS